MPCTKPGRGWNEKNQRFQVIVHCRKMAELPTSLIICFNIVEGPSRIFSWMALYGDITASFFLCLELQMSSTFPKLHKVTLAVLSLNNKINNVIGHCNENAFDFEQIRVKFQAV